MIIEKEKIEKILSSQEALDGELIRGWEETSRLFGDDRRTKILDLANSDVDEPIEVKRISYIISLDMQFKFSVNKNIYCIIFM